MDVGADVGADVDADVEVDVEMEVNVGMGWWFTVEKVPLPNELVSE